MSARHLIYWCAVLVATACGLTEARAAELVSLRTPRGATQAFIFLKSAHPVASLIMFAGDDGALGLKSATSMARLNDNFLVRTRDKFLDRGFSVAVVDVPSDHRRGINAVFRMGNDHAGDIGAVAAYLKQQASVPVWLVGTSMGTFSAAGGAIATGGTTGWC
jgi:hypothetical protein